MTIFYSKYRMSCLDCPACLEMFCCCYVWRIVLDKGCTFIQDRCVRCPLACLSNAAYALYMLLLYLDLARYPGLVQNRLLLVYWWWIERLTLAALISHALIVLSYKVVKGKLIFDLGHKLILNSMFTSLVLCNNNRSRKWVGGGGGDGKFYTQ